MQKDGEFEISADVDGDVEGEPIAIKLQSASTELNVWLTHSDIRMILSGVPTGEGVRALPAGRAADAQAFWALGPAGELHILVGQDDETWDFGITLSPASRDALVKVLQSLDDRRPGRN